MKRVVLIAGLAFMALGTAWANVPGVETSEAAAEIEDIRVSLPEVEVLEMACSCRDACFNDFQCMIFNGPGSTCEPTGPCGCKECSSAQLTAIVAAPVSLPEICEDEAPLADPSLQACFCLPECRTDRDCRRRFGKGSVCVIDTRCGCNTCAVAF